MCKYANVQMCRFAKFGLVGFLGYRGWMCRLADGVASLALSAIATAGQLSFPLHKKAQKATQIAAI